MDELTVLYFDIEHAVQTHDWILSQSGGKSGFNDIGLLKSTLAHIQNDLYYDTFDSKLNHLVFSTIKVHAFLDGNKRTSIALGAYFLELNGYDFFVTKFVQEMENIAVWVADNKIDKILLQEIISSLISEEEFSEELSLKIVDSLIKA